MPLTVLSIAFSYAPVSPASVGGAEQILYALDRALVEAGHTSLVIACHGSHAAGRLFPVRADQSQTLLTEAEMQRSIDHVIRSHCVDLVHMHGLDFHRYRIPSDVPVLVTLHLPIAWYPPEIWSNFSPRYTFCCVSVSQRAMCLPQLSEAFVIENGVDLSQVSRPVEKQNFALVLGRICPEKNQHVALEAGTTAGVPVVLAGQVFPYPDHQAYFAQKIRPLLQAGPPETAHRFIGPVGPEQKADLLAQARCLLHPTIAPETSSLVAMESLAAGTPAVAFRSGALPEIVEHGVTGFLVDDVAEMAAAIPACAELSPDACRGAAQKRFARSRMVHDYMHLYAALARNSHAGAALA